MRWARLAAAVCPAGRSGSDDGGHQGWSHPGGLLAVHGLGRGFTGRHRRAELVFSGAAVVSEEPREALIVQLLAQALETGRLVIGPVQGPCWRSFPAAPESVSQARRFTESTLAEVAETDVDHVDDVVLVVSELITNAVREVAKLAPAEDGACPVHLGIAVAPRWTHLFAVDPAPALPKEAKKGPMAGSGRGIPIIKSLAAMTWIDLGRASKTIHVVVTRTDVKLTPEDRQTLNP